MAELDKPVASVDAKAKDEAPPLLPSPTLPKSGGALASIGEKFQTNAHNGTASLTIPIFTSAGRGGFTPQLSLSYDAGSGNGPVGLGWSISVPNIARKTDKGLPRYDDAQDSDVFVLSGAEDLVPIGTSARGGETVVRYRPRVDDAFARIERHVRGDGTQYWVAWTRDNIRSVYGYSSFARIANPANDRLVFRWLLEWTDDDKGNVIAYAYKPEDDVNVAPALPEQNRQRTNLFLKAIAYANPQPRASRDVPPLDLSGGRAAALASWPLVVLFDYGDHDANAPTLAEGTWAARQDPFSSYRSGFEIRTHRLCQRVLMLHKFDSLGANHVVVRSTNLGYLPTPAVSYLTSVTQIGWQSTGAGYTTKAMPSVTLGYGTVGALDNRLRTLDRESARNLPDGLAGPYALTDYDGEGLAGVLSEEAGRGWFYKRPEGLDASGLGHFGRARRVEPRPSAALSDGFQFQDVNADGLVDLVRVGKKPEGVFERRDDQWTPFRAFPSVPNIDWSDPNLRFVDLDGDGFPDVLIADQDVFRWHRALGLDGYADELRTPKPLDRLGPVPLFATEREAVLLADMTGDGLSDVVHIDNGSVSYWPNLGYGRFGRRVQMANAPRLDTPEDFDPRRVRLADVDGTGTSDLVYVRADGVHVYLNQAGNSFVAQPVLRGLPTVHEFAHFSVSDLWGTGTACLVWSSPLPQERLKPLRWVDLLNAHKPHLLESIDNGFGATTTIEHAPSTSYYLADRAAGLTWITKLPFPVQVVARVTVEDAVAQTKLVSVYRYHHGFYDGVEREFRGFGMVEQQDTETLAAFAGKSGYPQGLDQTLYIPPALIKTWFHTGAFLDATTLSRQFASEYFAAVAPLADSTIVGTVLPEELREAYRALRGRPLRQETYALDGNDVPYVVTENNYLVRLEHARGQGRYASFSTHARETLTHHLERVVGDARVSHELVLRVGPYGEVQEHVSIGYPRAAAAARRPEQARLWAIHTLATTTPDHDVGDDDYRVTVPFESITSELVGLPNDHVLSFDEVVTGAAVAAQPWAPPAQRTTPGRWLVRRTQERYWDDLAATELSPGQAGVRALHSRTLTLALTRPYINSVWQGRATGVDLLAQQGGYLVDVDLFWSFRGIVAYDSTQFFQPTSLTNPFGGVTRLHYEAPLALLLDSTQDPVGNKTTVANDYRLLSPGAITDQNGTVHSVTTDALGIVTATAVQGRAGEGGTLATLDYSFFAGAAAPAVIHTTSYQEFGGATVEETWLYADGSGREAQRKRRVEPGPLDPNDPASPTLDPRYVGTGRTIFDNKGNPVKKYEPYFSATPSFDTESALVRQGITPILHYDPLNRLIRTDLPNGTYSQVLFDAWSRETWDEIDTLDASTPWYTARASGTYPREPALEQAAAIAALKLAQTPTRTHFDSLGRAVAVVRDAGTTDPQRFHETAQALDCEGSILSVTDPRSLVVVQQSFDVAGRRLFVDSVDGGRTWTLPDALGQTLYAWRVNPGDAVALQLRSEYDLARRSVGAWELPDGQPNELLRERTIYRDGATAPPYGAGRAFAELDGAGIVEYQYEFRGQPARVSRYVVADPQSPADWTSNATWDGTTALPSNVQNEELAVTHAYDATGRETQRQAFVGARSGGTIRHHFDRAGQLVTVDGDLPTRAATTPFVNRIAYDAHGRRVNVQFQNGVTSGYSYDPFTFRLDTIATSKGNQQFQSLVYAYDPVGNITAIRDDAQDTIYFGGRVIKPERDYGYDALYRLRSAVGREHLSQAAPDERDVPDPLALPVADPNDLSKVVSYTEQYLYDPSGNFQSMSHAGATTWTRTYATATGSNRLAKTTVGGFDSNYAHDARGNMTSMAHLASMAWNHRDQLVGCTRTRVGNTMDPSAATAVSNPVYFAYDLRGQRVLKQARTPTQVTDRVYLDGFELYRERPALGAPPTLERDTLHVLDHERRFALVETLVSGSAPGPAQQVRYQHDDHLDSAIVELDENALPLSYEELHPYGTTALYAGLASKRYRYTGKERDEETGLYYVGARYHAPWIGRWVSVDPEGTTQSPYSHSDNRPITLVDHDGRKPTHTDQNIFLRAINAGLDKIAQHLGRTRSDVIGVLKQQEREHVAQQKAFAEARKQIEEMKRFNEYERQKALESQRAAEEFGQQSAHTGRSRDAVPQSMRPDVEAAGRIKEDLEHGNSRLVLDATKDVAGQAAAAVFFGGVGAAFEERVVAGAAGRGERIVASNRKEVAQFLRASEKEAGRLSDVITRSGSKFNLLESKGAEELSAGSKIDEAVSQLKNTVKLFTENRPGDKLGRLEIAVPREAKIAGSEYAVRGSHVIDAVTGKVLKFAGKVVTIRRY